MQRISKPLWKQCALLIILLSHAVFGSPVVPPSFLHALSSKSQSDTLSESNHYVLLREENLDGPFLEKRGDRKKRFLYETFKKAKQAKLLTLGAASSNVAKSVGKSILKTVATLGLKAIIFNFLYKKINQVLDFKTRVLNNLENKNREQNSQVGIDGGGSDSSTAGSSLSSTTENPADRLPQFNPDKVSLQVPDAVFGPGFNIANGASQVFGTIVQNTALRIARLFEALKPLLRSSSTFKSKKRETEYDYEDLDGSKGTNSDDSIVSDIKSSSDKTPVKTSFTALTQR